MSLQTAKCNWQNFFRQMVGLPKMYPVKVVRDEKAKQFPLIQIKKAGDVCRSYHYLPWYQSSAGLSAVFDSFHRRDRHLVVRAHRLVSG